MNPKIELFDHIPQEEIQRSDLYKSFSHLYSPCESYGIGTLDQIAGVEVIRLRFRNIIEELLSPNLKPNDYIFSKLGAKIFLEQYSDIQSLVKLETPLELGAKKINSGSEADIYRLILDSKNYVLKVFNPQTWSMLDSDSTIGDKNASRPLYKDRFAFSDSIINSLEGFPLKTFEIKPLHEYMASDNLIIMDEGPKISVYDLFSEIGLLYSSNYNKLEIKEFIKKNKITPKQIIKLRDELERYLNMAELLLESNQRPKYFIDLSIDPFPANFLIGDFDKKTKKFLLYMIDQGCSNKISDSKLRKIYAEMKLDTETRDFLSKNNIKPNF